MRLAPPLACAALLLSACASDERSPFDPAADREPPALVAFEIITENQHVYAAWQASEPVHAVVEYACPADGTWRYSYPAGHDETASGLIKLLKLAPGAAYEDVRVRMRDRAGNVTLAAPETDSFTPAAVAADDLFLFAMIDVGWGDALYLEAPDGTNCLVDAGHPADGLKVRWFLQTYLDVQALDFASLSHVHEDHVGGFYGDDFDALDGLFQDNGGGNDPIPVGTFLDFTDKTPGTLNGPYDNLIGALGTMGTAFGVRVELPVGASSASEPALRWGGGVRVDLLSAGKKGFLLPDFALVDAIGSVQNNDSMVYRVQYGDFVLLLMGDGEFATEQFLQNRWPLDFLRADVLKLGHHGSNDANSERFLDVVDPRVALVTNAVSENPGVEHPFVLGRLRKRGTDYFASDRVVPNRDRAESGIRGDVLIYTDGGPFTFVVDNIVFE